MYEIKQHYLIQLENEQLRIRITELKKELQEIKKMLENQDQNSNRCREEAKVY